jgi:hypothetical protein
MLLHTHNFDIDTLQINFVESHPVIPMILR